VGHSRVARRPGYEDYSEFPARYANRCSVCATGLAVGVEVIGKRLDDRSWDILCRPCGTGVGPRPAADLGRVEPAVTRSDWSILVEYLLSCVLKESLAAPVPLAQRSTWAGLPGPAETVLCGNDSTVPLVPPLRDLFADLPPLQGVFYGWPTVIVLDERRRPFVAPLFLRQLGAPTPGAATVGVTELLPQVNTGLFGHPWFPPEAQAAAAAVLADGPVGFGRAAAVTDTAARLLTALGLAPTSLDPDRLVDPGTLGESWRPQEVGVVNLAMAFRGELDAATRNLVGDLQWLARQTDWDSSAARFLFQDAPAAPTAAPAAAVVRLNDSQEAALACAMTAPLTVITGPPGTGKSQTVTAILAEAWRRGETALLSSTNNQPVDDVVEHRAAAVDADLVLRTGNADKRRQLGERLTELVGRIDDRCHEPEADELAEAARVRHGLAATLHTGAAAAQAVLAAAIRRDDTRAQLWESGQPPAESDPDSVHHLAVRTDRTRWRWLRRRRTRLLAQRAGVSDAAVTAREILDWSAAEIEFAAAHQQLAEFDRSAPPDALEAFDRADRRWRAASEAAVRNEVGAGLRRGADALAELAHVLSRELPRRDAMRQAMTHVRGWATSALSTRPNFDCRAGSIDLVVIDEAGQCSLAHVLPLAYRAKRLVVVGDPQQLAPVVTANAADLRALATAAGADPDQLAAAHHTYGADSAYSAFAARFPPLLLAEHYRCHPEIIEFCNRQFYDGELTVLSPVDHTDDPARGLDWREVAGRTEPGRSGSVVNEAEAAAVADWVAGCGLPADRLGVVTPFRAQAARISALLRDRGLGAVRVGTAHRFQGGERDTIVFSTVLSAGAQPATVAWLEGERTLINVAVSRAKQHLVVFGNRAELRRLGATTLLDLATAATGHRRRFAAEHTRAARTLGPALAARGLPVTVGGQDEGYPLAFTLTTATGARIDVEVDEFPGGDPRGRTQRQRATRDANLRRLGWQVVRIPGWQAYLDPTGVADRLAQLVTAEQP
jgi:hypothetical protein